MSSFEELQNFIKNAEAKFYENSTNSDDSMESLSPDRNFGHFTMVNLEQIKKNYQKIKNCSPRIETSFTVRSNSPTELQEFFVKLGVQHFNCISKSEIKTLKKLLKTDMKNKVCFANPLKPKAVLQLAAKAGIKKFTVSSASDVAKISKLVNNPEF